jgi:hypothetical protein
MILSNFFSAITIGFIHLNESKNIENDDYFQDLDVGLNLSIPFNYIFSIIFLFIIFGETQL